MFEQTVNLGPGTGTYTQHTLEILIMLLGALSLGIWFGWATWAQFKQKADQLLLDNQSLNATVETLRNEISGMKSQLLSVDKESNNLSEKTDSLKSENINLLHEISTLESELATTQHQNMKLDVALGLSLNVDPAAPKDIPLEVVVSVVDRKEDQQTSRDVVLAENSPAPLSIEPTILTMPAALAANEALESIGEDGKRDDLMLVEGIDLKIQALLYQHGIKTYHQLSEQSVENLHEILASAVPPLVSYEPGTWPSQAALAANNELDTLKSVQGFLKNDVEPL
jgi:predicted flap endonuclease-1-like 5' DNA nuclease/outer membrane murein-binding lipoprotein Lpp